MLIKIPVNQLYSGYNSKNKGDYILNISLHILYICNINTSYLKII